MYFLVPFFGHSGCPLAPVCASEPLPTLFPSPDFLSTPMSLTYAILLGPVQVVFKKTTVSQPDVSILCTNLLVLPLIIQELVLVLCF
jgi:hypothetical protein